MNLICTLLALFGITLSGCGGGGSSPPPPPPPVVTIPDMGAYLATSRCADGRLAVLSGCPGAPQRASDPMLYRRADMSGHTDGQIEDAFVSDDGRYYVNSFSYPPNSVFTPSHGDGGDVMVIDGDHVRIDFTQNGTPGGGTIAGYWAGPGCLLGTGWLLFDRYAPTGSWRSAVARLAGSLTRGACPPLDSAYTRWRKETAAVPFWTNGGAQGNVLLPIVVSEHYAGTSIAGAGSMERIIMAQGIGRVAWQAFSRTLPAITTLLLSPIPPWTDTPAGWNLTDERLLTNVVPGSPMTGNQFGWPGAGFVP